MSAQAWAQAFALLASPEKGAPPLDPTPALRHTFSVADEAAYLAKDKTVQVNIHLPVRRLRSQFVLCSWSGMPGEGRLP